MTFLSPSVFWLLGALSIPIIIHILNRFRVRKVEYSSIALIDELRTFCGGGVFPSSYLALSKLYASNCREIR